jgi:hypothetical protein
VLQVHLSRRLTYVVNQSGELTDEEKQAVADVLEAWIDGFDEAEKETIADKTIESFDDLLNLTAGYHVDRSTLESVLAKLKVGSSDARE